MDNKILNKCIFGAMLLSLAACTQDELADGGNTLPEGQYPLEIASVTMDVTHSQQPWSADAPQTRMSESDDRNSSVWDGGENIGVRIANGTETAVYTLQSDKTALQPADKPLYWKNTTASKVCAWFPADGKVDLSRQTSELAYALFAETTEAVDYNTTDIHLPFEHKLAKVRVVLTGNKKDKVTEVRIKTCTSCTLNSDGTLTGGDVLDYIPMVKTAYNGETCWEANVVPDAAITEFQVNGQSGTLENNGITPVAAKVNTITLTVVKEVTPSDGEQTINLEDGDVVRISGEGKGSFTFNVSEGNTATVHLEDVTLGSEENKEFGLNLNGAGTFILKLNGTNTLKGFRRPIISGYQNGTSGNIQIEGPGTLKIEGSNMAMGIVTDESKSITIKDATINMDYQYSSGAVSGATIGSNSGETCGSITIINSDITITARVTVEYDPDNQTKQWYGAAIGAGFWGTCGSINITLKENQSKDQFLNKISVTNTKYNISLNKDQKVGKGIDGTSCGTITWRNSDGSPAN